MTDKERDHWEDRGIDGRMRSRWIFQLHMHVMAHTLQFWHRTSHMLVMFSDVLNSQWVLEVSFIHLLIWPVIIIIRHILSLPSRWQRSLTRRYAAVWLLAYRVRIPLWALMFVRLFCLHVVLSCVGRGLCDGLTTRPEESYRVSVWLRNLDTEEDRA
jgi:hypothetical protein